MEYNRNTISNGDTPSFYRFISLFQGYFGLTRDYGDGVQRSMGEMHILQIICHNPGITGIQVAQKWGKTKGAVSQNVTKLEKKGLVERRKNEENAREIKLYPTEEGCKLSAIHESYDKKEEDRIARELMARCSMEDLITFSKVLDVYSDILEEDLSRLGK